MPISMARLVASAIVFEPSLCNMERRWNSMVFSLMHIFSAISRLLQPDDISFIISISFLLRIPVDAITSLLIFLNFGLICVFPSSTSLIALTLSIPLLPPSDPFSHFKPYPPPFRKFRLYYFDFL